MTGPNLLVLLLSTPAMAQECTAPTPPEALLQAAERGEQGFSDLDLDALTQAASEAESALPCVSDPIPLDVAAAYHRLMGLSAFANGDRERVVYEFSAARVSQPGYTMPEELAPPGHPLQLAYDEALTLDGGEAETPLPPMGGYVMVAGVRDGQRKKNRPAIVQVYQADGSWVETRYIAPGESMPLWGPPPSLPQPPAEGQWRRKAAIAGALGVAAGGLYGTAAIAGDRFDAAESERAMTLTYKLNRGSVAGAGLSAAGAIALGVWAYTDWRAESRAD